MVVLDLILQDVEMEMVDCTAIIYRESKDVGNDPVSFGYLRQSVTYRPP